jgi:hypothetical protein
MRVQHPPTRIARASTTQECATFTAATASRLRYRDTMADRAATLDLKPDSKLLRRLRTEAATAVPRRIRTGPLPTLPRGDLTPVHGIEGRLPLLLLAGFAVLAAIQVSLAF